MARGTLKDASDLQEMMDELKEVINNGIFV